MLIVLFATLVLAQPAPGDAPAEPGPSADDFVDPALLFQPTVDWPAGQPFEAAAVELDLLIDETGAVKEVSLVSGEAPFSEIALKLAPELRFSPASAGGVPEAVYAPFVWTFAPPPVRLRGVVRTADGLPAAGLAVSVGDRELLTDEEGRFELRDLPDGPVQVSVRADGYTAPVLTVDLREGTLGEVEIALSPVEVADVAVGTYRRPSPAAVVHVLEAEDMRTTPGTLGDPVRVVQNMPGVTRTPLDSGWLLVRGGSPGDTGLYIDGVRVPLVYHLGGFTSVIHPLLVQEVSFMPGGVGARYGQATGGAVEIKTRPASAYRAQVGADIIYANAYAEAPLGEHGGVAIAARRSYLDRLLSVVLSEEQAAIAPRFWDGTLRLDSRHFGLMLLTFDDNIEVPINASGDTAQVSISTRRAHGRASGELFGGQLSSLVVVARDERFVSYTGVSDSRTENQVGLRTEWTGDLAPSARLNTGFEGQLIDYTIRVDRRREQANIGSINPYGELRLGDLRWISLGFRLETWKIEEQLWDVSPSPRLAGELPLSPEWKLSADFGLYHQPPPNEWRVGLPVGAVLRPERAVGEGIGLRWGRDPFALELDGYWRNLYRVTLFEADGTLGQGQGLAYGVEALGRWGAGPLSGWLSFTWSRSLRREEPGHLYKPSLYDQPLYLVNVVSWDMGHDLNLATRYRVGSGYPWDGKTEELYDLLTLTAQPIYADENNRLRPYHALDVKLAWSHAGRRLEGQVYLDVQNVYFRRVEEPIITGIDDRETVYALGLPTLPILGFQVGWKK